MGKLEATLLCGMCADDDTCPTQGGTGQTSTWCYRLGEFHSCTRLQEGEALMAGQLIAHCGAQYMYREGLKLLETPEPTDSWTPIPHYDLVQALDGQLRARGITIVKEQFAVQKAKMFGVIDTNYQVTEEGGAAIGIRTANEKSLALQL